MMTICNRECKVQVHRLARVCTHSDLICTCTCTEAAAGPVTDRNQDPGSMTVRLASVASEPAANDRQLGPPKSRNRPYDNRPRSGPGRAARRPSPRENAVRVVLPDEPPRLTPGAAQALLRILIKAHDRLAAGGNPQGDAE